MAERYDSSVNKQYLYLAWDETCGAAYNNRFRSYLKVYDITTETSPVQVRSYVSNVCAAATQDFLSVVEVARGSTNGGWYFYRQETTSNAVDPCKTTFRGFVTTSATFASLTSVQISSGQFPTVLFAGPSMGDYVGTTDGLAFGVLNPAWAQPITTGAPGGTQGCVNCQGTKYTLRVMGNTITP